MEEYLKTGVFDDNIYDLLSLIIKSNTNALCIESSNSRNQNLIKMIANKLVAEGQRIVMISEDEINQGSFEDIRAKDFVEIKNSLCKKTNKILKLCKTHEEIYEMIKYHEKGYFFIASINSNDIEEYLADMAFMLSSNKNFSYKESMNAIANSIQFIIIRQKYFTGEYKIKSIVEVCDLNKDGSIKLNELFRYKVEDLEVDKRTGCKKLKGRFVKTGKLSPEMQLAFRGMNV
ncbi:hypothetical protein [Clostridioides difficile]|uniref:hypothetical protein n=1 Tax=Clostridioides difficile TaxID=1496 RepID=UPI0010339290|nr:hypothetical protein [Clostridioides difficile]